jgi:trehalose synthase
MLDAYRSIVPDHALEEVYDLAAALKGRALQHVNSTRAGGGVAEILHRLVPLTEALGIATRWDVLVAEPAFFDVTKRFHNALQGDDVEVTREDLDVYLECVAANADRLRPTGDVVVVHDPQPAYLIERWPKDRPPAAWRCHIDLSHPNDQVWRFLRRAVHDYRAAIFHVPQFARDLPIPQLLIAPSIDPLSEKNRELTEAEISRITDRFGIDRKRPLLVQVSRFDRFKDPLGVIRAFRMIQASFGCQLVLAGGGADDDPEAAQVLSEVQEAAGRHPDIHVLNLPSDSNLEINALQRAATVVLQKSTREGFGLTVTEAMWKGKPVIAGAVGGIPSQVTHGVHGFLVHSPEGAAFRLRSLLSHPKAAARMGERAREHVRQNFLIVRHVRDYLLLMLVLLHAQDGVPLAVHKAGVRRLDSRRAT